jgi:hypothetical protein
MVFENTVLRRIFGPKTQEVVGRWRRLHNEESHNLEIHKKNIKVIKSLTRWPRNVARMVEIRNAHKILVGKLEVKRSLGRPRRRWKDSMKMYLKK